VAKTKEGSSRRGKPHILYFFTNCDGNWLKVFLIGGGGVDYIDVKEVLVVM
jgi:hypothetical protein